jgi:small conductance mechanosensitive channel
MNTLKEMNWNEIFTGNGTLSDLVDYFSKMSIDFGLKILAAIVIYIIGRKLIKWLSKLIDKVLSGKNFDQSVASFIRSLVNIILMGVLLLSIVDVLGVKTTSIVALLASVGVGMGLAMSGTLQNFAGGVMILLFRPFKVGDYIEAQGQGGTVKEIQIFNTIIVTVDNRTIYMPNGGLSSNVIVNYNNQKNRRIEWVLNVAYGTNYDKAKAIIDEIVKDEKRILASPAPEIALKALNESSVDIQLRAWVKRDDYWTTYYDINERVYKMFNDKGIDIPFPQLTVHLEK